MTTGGFTFLNIGFSHPIDDDDDDEIEVFIVTADAVALLPPNPTFFSPFDSTFSIPNPAVFTPFPSSLVDIAEGAVCEIVLDDNTLLALPPELPLFKVVEIKEPPEERDFVLAPLPPPETTTLFLPGDTFFSPRFAAAMVLLFDGAKEDEEETVDERGGEEGSAKIGKMAPFLRI